MRAFLSEITAGRSGTKGKIGNEIEIGTRNDATDEGAMIPKTETATDIENRRIKLAGKGSGADPRGDELIAMGQFLADKLNWPE